ncbi:hypothetical protein COCON_G00006090 [Conger conger]|uniref:GON-4-like protein n=1 Tax=Conger conger TaxID=82655 RepID=A0A9Q1E1I0_CONCO|nr:hypothetical protein COCON_G00006090 [Conger conger]
MKTSTALTRSKLNMKMARKRKSSCPEERLTRSKARKEAFVSRCQPSPNAPLSIENRKISTPVKKKVQGIDPDAPSPRRYSPRFKCQKETPSKEHSSAGHVQVMELQHCSSPVQHPLQEEEDTELGLVITLDEEQCAGRCGGRRKGGEKVKWGWADEEADGLELSHEETGREGLVEVELCRQLDRALERKSRRHNLTNANVRSILHEVITNEQVVAMMKAAIRETQDMPMFEPKMTRSRLKEVVEKGVVIPTWNISPIKKASEVKPPQFVDIPLEEEDSSDEEYCPDEDEEDETGEETFLESDVDSTASSPRGSRAGRPRTPMNTSECDEDRSSSPRQPAGPPRAPRAPPECSFMEKLNAVEEELDSSLICIEPYQMSGGGGLMACRTRSKRPLRDVPLGRLEAELRAPDITPDMYDCSSTLEDREWTHWLQSLMTSDGENEEEGDDEDDPEYNFLDDIDEPDLEDYRNDRAVRITKKEVNELMEELFETFQDELGVQEQDEEGQEEEERAEKISPQAPKFNVPQAIRFEEPLANMLTECRRAVKVQLEALQQRRALMESQARGAAQNAPGPQVLLVPPPCALILTPPQKLQLQQQIQQHIQLLTQVHMLSSPVEALQSEASTSRHFLSELQSFAERGEETRATVEPGFRSIFRACNLQGALSLLEELKLCPAPVTPAKPTRSYCVRPYPLLPSKLAWLLATRPVFLHPELLPQCSLDPALHPRRTKTGYTKGEDSLILLGLRHFGETEFPFQLLCRYLIRTKTHEQVRGRVHDMCHRRGPDNVFKLYFQRKALPPMPLACGRVMPGQERPPVEREEAIMPNWLRKSLPYIHRAVMQYNQEQWQASPESTLSTPPFTFPPGTRYPLPSPKVPGGVTTCILQTPQVQAAVPNQRLRPRKLLPIQPAPLRPLPELLQLHSFSAGGGLPAGGGAAAGTASGAGEKSKVGKRASPTMILNLTAPIGTAVSAGLARPPAEPTPPPQDPVTHPNGALARLRKLVRPLLPAPPHSAPPQSFSPAPADGPVTLIPSPRFVSHAPSPPPGGAPENRTGPGTPPVQNGVNGAESVADHRTPSDAPQFTCVAQVNSSTDCATIVPCTTYTGTVTPPLTVDQNLLVTTAEDSSAPAVTQEGGPQYILVQTTAQGTTQFLLLPQNCLVTPVVTSQATPHAVTGDLSVIQAGAPWASGTVSGEDLPNAALGVDPSEQERVELQTPSNDPKDTQPPVCPGPPSSTGDQQTALTSEDNLVKLVAGFEGLKVKEEAGEEDGEDLEEEESGDFGGSLLALSESSGSPASSLECCADTLERIGPEMEQSTPRSREGEGKGVSDVERDSDVTEGGEGDCDRGGGESQDEDEEEVMSSASEESVLSVPELQETMEKLTWLASEGRLCGEGDSEEDNSPNSPNSPTSPTSPVSQNSQEENSEEEEEGPPKGEESESGEGGAGKLPSGEVPQGRAHIRPAGRGPAGAEVRRGRPPPRSLKRSRRQERDSKDASKLPLLYDDRILDNDPLRESKDIAFAQAYLNRVREALQDVPGKVEEFLGLLYEFEQGGEGGEGAESRSAVELFSQLRPVLRDWPDLLRDFAAFLLPEQALECGLFAEQQAFERSRRFLRQLEISFGENPSHYQKIVRALQGGPSLSDAGIDELKAQMASLLKGHTHLQGEFWVFFDELRPPPSRPGQFEEAAWPEEGGGVTDGGGDGGGVGPVGGASGGFEEVTLPDLEEEEEVHKIAPLTGRSKRRKELGTHSNDKECDWSEKDCSCPCHDANHDAKLRRHKRKGCCRCHTNKVTESSRGGKSRDTVYPGSSSLQQDSQAERRAEEREEEREGEKEVETEVKDEGGSDAHSPHPGTGSELHCPEQSLRETDQGPQPWDGPEGSRARNPEDKEEEEEEEWKEVEREGSPSPKKSRKDREEAMVCDGPPAPPSGEREREASPATVPPRPSPGADPPVCAKNISLTPSGEKVILWTREADRVILTACQQQGANQSTFQAVSAQLGNKTANEVSRRFRDLMRLFHTAARQVSSEDEASNAEELD